MKENNIIRDCLIDEELKCPNCQNKNHYKHEELEENQRYKCKYCNNSFINLNSYCNTINLQRNLLKKSSLQDIKLLDVWDLRILGKEPTSNGGFTINFTNINPDWLKQAIKNFIWFKIINSSTITIIKYVSRLKVISNFLKANSINLRPIDINRELVVDLINDVASSGIEARTIEEYIYQWKYFFEFCQENKIIPKSQGKLIYSDDYPKRKKSLIKDIPDYVLKQLKTKITNLPKSIVLMVEILLETGMRISEVCKLPFNCIQQDSDGDWWIDCFRSKVNKEDRLFISKELAIKIQEQQKFIRDSFELDFDYLFCTTKNRSWFNQYGTKYQGYKRELSYFIPVPQPITQNTVRGYLKQLAHEHNITDVSSQIYPIWKCHRFRHTHLTDLAKKGTGIAHIMQRAGHTSPQMAMQYIHLTNDDQKKKMKEVWDNSHFNMEGEIVAPVNPDLNTAEMQWIKKGMGVQTTDNGYCTLLWTQTCPHQQLPCKECGSWITTLDFLDSHKKELEETEKIIENARQKGYQRQIEKNVPRAERLRKIISGMEQHQTMRGIGNNEWEEKK